MSENLAEKIVEIVPETELYRKSEDVLETVSNVALSFETIRTVIMKSGDKITNLPKEYRNIIEELIERKQYDKIQSAIDGLKYELGGEYTAVKKLNKLQSYLSKDLARYNRYSRDTRSTRRNRISQYENSKKSDI